MITFWHDDNPWRDDVVYVTLEELAECVDKGNGLVRLPDDVAVSYDNRWLMNHWQLASNALDAYILPQPSGDHSIGVRWGSLGSQYFSPMAHKERTQALLDKRTKTANEVSQ